MLFAGRVVWICVGEQTSLWQGRGQLTFEANLVVRAFSTHLWREKYVIVYLILENEMATHSSTLFFFNIFILLYTEWSKPERKTPIQYTNAYIWNLERWWWWLQYTCLENPKDRGAWWATVHVVTKSQIRLSNFTFTFHFHALNKEMATHSSILAWRVPGTEEPGGLLSIGSHRVRHE